MPNQTLTLDTPLGYLRLGLNCSTNSVPDRFSFALARLNPPLPKGMAVSDCFGLLVRVVSGEGIEDLTLSAELMPSSGVMNGAETGQGLEAQAWRSSTHVLMVGTEDAEWLVARLGDPAGFVGANFTYSAQSFSVCIPSIAPNALVSLHLVIAWNVSPEPHDCSCWYAIDRPHSEIIEVVGHG